VSSVDQEGSARKRNKTKTNHDGSPHHRVRCCFCFARDGYRSRLQLCFLDYPYPSTTTHNQRSHPISIHHP
jgi:hypothetical protein